MHFEYFLIICVVSGTHDIQYSTVQRSVSVTSYVKFLSWPVGEAHLLCHVKFNEPSLPPVLGPSPTPV